MSSPLPTHKTCCQCFELREAGAFLPSPLTADGLTDRCKPCIFGNAARDRAEREVRRQASTPSRVPVSATARRLSYEERTTP